MSDELVESRAQRELYFRLKADYATKFPTPEQKPLYLDRVHLLPDIPLGYATQQMHLPSSRYGRREEKLPEIYQALSVVQPGGRYFAPLRDNYRRL